MMAEREKINLCFDGIILKNCGHKSTDRSGIYWTACAIFTEMRARDINVYTYFDAIDDEVEQFINYFNFPKEKILTNSSNFNYIDVFYSPAFYIPSVIRQYPQISKYTILYDTIPFLFPKYFAVQNHWIMNLVNSLNKDDYYFAISDYTKRDFLKYCPKLDAKKIDVLPLSSNQNYQPNKDKKTLEKIKQKYKMPTDKKYLFSLCSLEPRKNLIRTVKTFVQFIAKNKIDDLVFVLGGGHWDAFIPKLKQEIANLGDYADKIVRIGYVDDEDLEVLYSNAEWFVYTSQYEGFGMPPLEAMKCGCPVITSNNSSLPEVVGKAGLTIDWDSDEQHIKAYEKYWFDKKFREEMAKKGLERSKQFSWQKSVDIILKRIKEVEAKKAQQPLVTVITPTFNLLQNGRKEMFWQNVESVRSQTYKNIEHIIIDGASTDGTLKLLQEQQKKGLITYISEADKGIFDALNKGILKAKGKYVVCLNADDVFANEQSLALAVKKAEELEVDAANAYTKSGALLLQKSMLIELGLYNTDDAEKAGKALFYKMLQQQKKFFDVSFDLFADVKDAETQFWREYGQFHYLSPLDIANLNNAELPLPLAVELGAKLDKPEWREEYFKRLLERLPVQGDLSQVLGASGKNIRKFKCSLFNCIPLFKSRTENENKAWFVFGFLPLYSYKHVGGRKQWKVFGLPLFKVRKMANGITTKYYLFGMPLLKLKTGD